jgi:heat shock protein beta
VVGGLAAAVLVLSGCNTTDGDDDGLPDEVELQVGWDPDDADQDGDGTVDSEQDSDGDGYPDLVELALATDPTDAADPTDRDGDGLDDPLESIAGTSIDDADTDGDGTPDGREVIRVGTQFGLPGD